MFERPGSGKTDLRVAAGRDGPRTAFITLSWKVTGTTTPDTEQCLFEFKLLDEPLTYTLKAVFTL